MTTAEKLRFLADRIEDEKQFYIGCRQSDEPDGISVLFIYQKGKLMQVLVDAQEGFECFESSLSLDTVLWLNLALKPQWEFTEDEKVILRNLPNEFRWIARDEPSNMIYVYTSKPTAKVDKHWVCIGDIENLNIFRHLFQSIQWSDDEPCEFRKYL